MAKDVKRFKATPRDGGSCTVITVPKVMLEGGMIEIGKEYLVSFEEVPDVE